MANSRQKKIKLEVPLLAGESIDARTPKIRFPYLTPS